MTLCWTLLFLSSALLASGQAERSCRPPRMYGSVQLSVKTAPRRSFAHLDTVHYTCARGLAPSGGTATVRCEDGRWSKLTLKCEKPKANCSAPAVTNSVRSNVTFYKLREKVIVACPQGFQLEGPRVLTCGPKGEWRPRLPQCVSVPTEASSPPAGKCATPGPVSTPNVSPVLPDPETMTSFNDGDMVRYVCDAGYVTAGGSRYRTCRDGQWSRLALKCEPMMCGSAGEIVNGEFTYTGVEFGDTATAVCNKGFHLVGRGIRHCLSEGWDGRLPVCEAMTCPDPQVTNARRTDRREPPHTYRSVIRYQCASGTLIGQRDIWCTEGGTWNTAPPTCQEITCPSPDVQFAFWTSANGLKYQYRQTVHVQCEARYSLIGPNTISCGRDGQWLPSLPTCRRDIWG